MKIDPMQQRRSGLRRRSLLLAVLAVAAAAIAASAVSKYVSGVRAQIGPLLPIVTARQDIPEGKKITASNVGGYFQVRQLAQRYLPHRYYSEPGELIGTSASVGVPQGTYITPGQFGEAGGQGSPLVDASGTRVVDVPVAGPTAGSLGPGSTVDVLVTVAQGEGSGSAYLALEAAPVVRVSALPEGVASDGDGPATEGANTIVSLHVTARQAVYLTAAQSFAERITVLPRPPGDRKRLGGIEITESGLVP